MKKTKLLSLLLALVLVASLPAPALAWDDEEPEAPLGEEAAWDLPEADETPEAGPALLAAPVTALADPAEERLDLTFRSLAGEVKAIDLMYQVDPDKVDVSTLRVTFSGGAAGASTDYYYSASEQLLRIAIAASDVMDLSDSLGAIKATPIGETHLADGLTLVSLKRNGVSVPLAEYAMTLTAQPGDGVITVAAEVTGDWERASLAGYAVLYAGHQMLACKAVTLTIADGQCSAQVTFPDSGAGTVVKLLFPAADTCAPPLPALTAPIDRT